MSIAEKLEIIAENERRVYDAGVDAGHEVGLAAGMEAGMEAGQKAEYDRFWDAFQNKGEKTSYSYAFGGDGFTASTYNPKYQLNCTHGANMMFAYNATITDTKVDIDFGNTSSNKVNAFYGATSLHTIRKIKNCENVNFASMFTDCNALANVTFDGVISRNFNMQWCPLTVESMKNIISCLKNFAGTDSAYTTTLTFSEACWSALEADSTAPDGGKWKEYVQNVLCWNA